MALCSHGEGLRFYVFTKLDLVKWRRIGISILCLISHVCVFHGKQWRGQEEEKEGDGTYVLFKNQRE